MRTFTINITALGLSLALIGYTATFNTAVAAKNMSHVHMDHVTKAWKDTPDGQGFLPTAIAEAKIAAQHAGFAAKKLDDLDWMKLHVRHVRHAVDASLEVKGPGMGYGVLRASTDIDKHINFAASSDNASENVRAHTVHVVRSSENTLDRIREITTLSEQVLNAASASEAAPSIKRIKLVAEALSGGVDVNGDGSVSWKKGEGGLDAVTTHMALMAKGEGMN